MRPAEEFVLHLTSFPGKTTLCGSQLALHERGTAVRYARLMDEPGFTEDWVCGKCLKQRDR